MKVRLLLQIYYTASGKRELMRKRIILRRVPRVLLQVRTMLRKYESRFGLYSNTREPRVIEYGALCLADTYQRTNWPTPKWFDGVDLRQIRHLIVSALAQSTAATPVTLVYITGKISAWHWE